MNFFFEGPPGSIALRHTRHMMFFCWIRTFEKGHQFESLKFWRVLERVPGLPIRDDATGYNNCVQICVELCAIYVTEKYFSSVFIWFYNCAKLRFESTVPMHPQLQPFSQQLFLNFCAIFFPEWHLIFFVIMIHKVIWPSPGTLGPGGLEDSRLGSEDFNCAR